MKETIETVSSAQLLKPLNRISWNFVQWSYEGYKVNIYIFKGKKNVLCVSFITNIQLWFTTWLTNTTFNNGDMHNVQHFQSVLERGVCEPAHFFFH